MQLAPTHTHVTSIVKREDERITQQSLQRGLLRVTFHADEAHGIVHHLHGKLRAIDLGHDRQLFPAPARLLKVMAGLPGQVARRLNAHLDGRQHVADVLVLNERYWTQASLGFRKVKSVFKGGAHHANAGCPYQRCRPGERARHDLETLTWMADEVVGRYPYILKVYSRCHHPTMPQFVVDIDDLHAGSVTWHHHHCQRFACSLGRVGAAYDRVQMWPLSIPSGTIGGVVFLSGNDPFIPIAAGERLHPRCSIDGVEVGTASHLGKRE